MGAIIPSTTMVVFALLVLLSTWGSISTAFVIPSERNLAHMLPQFEHNGCFDGRATVGTGKGRWNAQQHYYYLPSSASCTDFRLNAAVNNNDDDEIIPNNANNNNNNNNDNNNTTNINGIAVPIPEKIRWILDGDFDLLDEDDDDGDDHDDDSDSDFDDLFLTDDEDDGFVIDDSDDGDDDGPDATLSKGYFMRLHDTFPDLKLATTTTAVGASSTASMWTSGSTTTNNTGEIPTMATDIATTTATASDAITTTTTVSLDNILASLESDLSYFYLRDELGIPEDTMWKITNEAPSVLGLKAKTVRNKVQVLQSLVGFTDAEIRQLITSQPTLLQLSVKKNLSPTILYWIRQLEMGKSDLKALILGCPALLKYSRTNIHCKLAFFRTTMGYSLSDCRKLLVKDPRLLTSSVMTGLIPRLNFLNKEVDISLPDIRKIALKNPRILLMSIENNLTPKCVFYFIMTLQMESKEVGKMLLKYPQVLDYNLEHHILPIHHYFLSLDFSTHEFSRILRRYPRLITYSLIRIKRRIGYLRFELGLEANAIRRILHQCPQIVSLGQENIEDTVDFLLQAVAPGASFVGSKTKYIQSSSDGKNNRDNMYSYDETTTKGGGDARDDAASGGDKITTTVETDDGDDHRDALTIIQILIPGLPTLLALSIEDNLKPKVEYLRDRLGQEELSNSLLRLPALLGYSLENRIRPRLERIVAAELPCGKITVAITLKEDAFDGWLERQIQNRSKNNLRRLEIKKKTKKNTAAKKATTMTTGRSYDSMSSGNEKNFPEEPTAEDDDTDTGTNKGNSRIVEEGGKITHWRR